MVGAWIRCYAQISGNKHEAALSFLNPKPKKWLGSLSPEDEEEVPSQDVRGSSKPWSDLQGCTATKGTEKFTFGDEQYKITLVDQNGTNQCEFSFVKMETRDTFFDTINSYNELI